MRVRRKPRAGSVHELCREFDEAGYQGDPKFALMCAWLNIFQSGHRAIHPLLIRSGWTKETVNEWSDKADEGESLLVHFGIPLTALNRNAVGERQDVSEDPHCLGPTKSSRKSTRTAASGHRTGLREPIAFNLSLSLHPSLEGGICGTSCSKGSRQTDCRTFPSSRRTKGHKPVVHTQSTFSIWHLLVMRFFCDPMNPVALGYAHICSNQVESDSLDF